MNIYFNFPCTTERVHLEDAKRELFELLVRKRQALREVVELKDQITTYENFAKEALNKGLESLAEEIAEKIARLESELLWLEKSNDDFFLSIDRLISIVRGLERRQKYPVHNHYERYQYFMDRLDAAEELEQGSDDRELQQKMLAAGIGKQVSNSQKILDRIRNQDRIDRQP